MVSEDLFAVQIGVDFNLVDRWFNLTPGQKVDHHWHCAIAYSDTFGETFVYKCFHLLPQNVEGRRGDSPVLTFKVDWQMHPVDHVKVNVVEFKLAKRLTTSPFDVAIVAEPKLGSDEQIRAGDSSFHHFLQSFSDYIFIVSSLRCVDVSVTMIQDCGFDQVFTF